MCNYMAGGNARGGVEGGVGATNAGVGFGVGVGAQHECGGRGRGRIPSATDRHTPHEQQWWWWFNPYGEVMRGFVCVMLKTGQLLSNDRTLLVKIASR